MNDNTINADVTMGGPDGALLAGRYRVVKQLGQGGMGSVWLAEDEKLDGFKVAIKMLPSVLVNNKRAYQQVKAEALVSLKLSHPNIATVRAFEEESGSPFLVMDYIDGQTLDDYLAEKGKLTEDETVRLLKPIAAALDYAHGQGIIHRDVKPANVMIRNDGQTFILDFGIAREIQETMTRVTGKLSSGTLLYMSPEQLRGQSPKSAQDVYSFAAMAYECLKGEPPFSRGQIEYQILNEQPERLSDGIRMSASIMRGLSKTPEARPDSCVKVLLTPCPIRQMPSVRPQVSVPPRLAAPMTDRLVVRQKRNIVGLVFPLFCLIVSLLVLGGVLWHREAKRQETARRLAVEQQQEELRRRQAEDKRKAQEAAARKKAEAERLAKLKQEEAQRKAEEEAKRCEAEKQARERELERQKEEEARKAAEAEKAAIAAREKAESDKAMALQNAKVALETLANDPWQYESVSMKLTQEQRDVLAPLFQEILSGDAEIRKMMESYTENHPAVKEKRLQQNYRISQLKSVVKSIQNVGVQGFSTSLALPTERFENYVVKAGDSFARVARSHGSSIGALKELNGLDDHQLQLRVGQVLLVPIKTNSTAENTLPDSVTVTRENLCGRWTGTTTCWWGGTTTHGIKQSTVSSRCYNYTFCKDGAFICEWTNVPNTTTTTSTTVEQGTWELVGNKLVLSFVTSNTRYSTGMMFNNKPPPARSLTIIRRGIETIELRRDIEELRSQIGQHCTDVEVYYDDNGTLHYGAKLGDGRPFSNTETAMILKRIKDV